MLDRLSPPWSDARGLRFVRRLALVAACVALLAALPAVQVTASATQDIAAARALFEANLNAIRHRDREAYLACYLESDSLARSGPDGMSLGYRELAKSAGEKWPDVFEAQDLQLVSVRPGLVYGTYRYRVRYGSDEQSGLSERLFSNTDRGWRIAVTTAFQAPQGTAPPPRALIGATLVDGTGAPPVRDAVVVMRDGKIECVGTRSSCKLPAGIETVDLKGMWITPGLVDAHVHFSQTGWADGRPDFIDVRDRYPYEALQARLRRHPEPFLRAYLGAGVTAVFDVGGYPWTWDLARRSEADTRSPHVAAAGPLLSTLDFWLNLPGERQFIYLADEKAARAGVRYLASHGSAAVKVWFIPVASPPFDTLAARVMAAGDEARRLGLPLIVHATGLREAKAALRAGARVLVHSVWDLPVDAEFLDLARRNQTIYCPTLTVVNGYSRLADAVVSHRAPLVDDPNGCVDSLTLAHVAESAALGGGIDAKRASDMATRNAERAKVAAANLKRVQEAGITIAMGTDAGNPLTLHGPSVYAEMEAMQSAGLKPMQVLVASTRGGAQAMGRARDFGTVEKGKSADLVVVGADPARDIAHMRQVRYVVRGGVLRAESELHASAPEKPEPAAKR